MVKTETNILSSGTLMLTQGRQEQNNLSAKRRVNILPLNDWIEHSRVLQYITQHATSVGNDSCATVC